MAYSEQDISRMKQEAIRRVREMQKHSRSVLGGHSESAEKANINDSSQEQNSNETGSLLGSLLGSSGSKLTEIAGIPIDEEKALIAMLIYILYKQGADVKLLLGLGYLLL